MNMIDVTSSTAQASSAEATAVTETNFQPDRFGIDTINWTIQVKNPRSRSAPTTTIMPTRNKITFNSLYFTKCGTSSERLNISTASPRNATASRKFQKNSVPKIMPMKTPQVTA